MKRLTLGTSILGLTVACASGGAPRPATAAGAPAGRQQVASEGTGTQQIATGDLGGEEPSDAPAQWGIVGGPSYASVVDKVVGMVDDPAVVNGARRRGLRVLNVMWEDTGRAQGSVLGPNISDLTLQVRYRRPGTSRGREQTALMPVIRFPNFTDRTGDVPADKFFVRVGNHRRGQSLRTVPLRDVLRNVKRYASRPSSIRGSGNLLAPRDTHFLVSAQAVFLPIPKTGKAEFNPVVFNYQSAPGSPAVLAILVTRQGSSMTVIENRPDDNTVAGWGQELYFNNGGMRAAYTAERKSDVKKRIAAQGGPKTADDRTALQRGADSLFLIQIPLKHENRGYLGGVMTDSDAEMEAPTAAGAAITPAPAKAARRRSDVEQAVLGHGRNRGPFTEGDGLRLVRDTRFPIRITVQFYKATSNGIVTESDLDRIARSIGAVYEHADYVGSLVVPNGDPHRPTEWQRVPNEWFPW